MLAAPLLTSSEGFLEQNRLWSSSESVESENNEKCVLKFNNWNFIRKDWTPQRWAYWAQFVEQIWESTTLEWCVCYDGQTVIVVLRSLVRRVRERHCFQMPSDALWCMACTRHTMAIVDLCAFHTAWALRSRAHRQRSSREPATADRLMISAQW